MIEIDESRTNNLTEEAQRLLKNHYVREGETIQEAYARAARCFSGGDSALAQRLYDYVSKGWFMFASPLLSNAVNEGDKVKGLPISCFVTYVENSINGLCNHTREVRYMTVVGGGVGSSWSAVQGISKKSPGTVGFLHSMDADMLAYKQGSTRRGAYAAYMNINHPDIREFILMRTPSGDLNRKNLTLHNGVNITDDFIKAVDEDGIIELRDPETQELKGTERARDLWELILNTRYRTGEPMLHYIDEANRRLPESMKAANMKIHSSNLCSEIELPTNKNSSAVCCLSSVNLAKYDEWKDTNMIRDLVYMLDNTLDFFVKHAPADLSKAVHSVLTERDIGLGAMGFADYLYANNVCFESAAAISINRSMFSYIKDEAVNATEELGLTRGFTVFADGVRRNAHLLAIAPNANSSIILNVSPSIEPRYSNAYTQKTRVGSFLVKNPYLEKLIKAKGLGDDVWRDIIKDNGSIQNLPYFTDDEKAVFKTALEIDQSWVVDMARSRAEYICQSQSVNLFFRKGVRREYLNRVHRRAFSRNAPYRPLKSLYYLRTESSRTTESVRSTVEREALRDFNECLSCQG